MAPSTRIFVRSGKTLLLPRVAPIVPKPVTTGAHVQVHVGYMSGASPKLEVQCHQRRLVIGVGPVSFQFTGR